MEQGQQCIEAYQRLKNLKLVGDELGIPWQSVYVNLKKAGVPVTGDKSRYGSDKDRLAARAEQEFQRLVPIAESQNEKRYQSKIDFLIGETSVDIKASLQHAGHVNANYMRWAFSMKKQEMLADFVVCFGYYPDWRYELLLLPGEIIRKYQTVSIAVNGKSKWRDYQIAPDTLAAFFVALPAKA